MTHPGRSGSNGGGSAWSSDAASPKPFMEKTQEVAGRLAEQARDQVKSQLTHQKERATDTLEGVEQSFRSMEEQLREQHQAALAGCAEAMAETVDRFSAYLRNK